MIYLLLGTLAVIAACEALTRLYRRHLRTRTEEAFLLGFGAGARAVWEVMEAEGAQAGVQLSMDREHFEAQVRNAQERRQ